MSNREWGESVGSPVELDYEYTMHELLNETTCHICDDKLYWKPLLMYVDSTSSDMLYFTASCCGFAFTAKSQDTSHEAFQVTYEPL